MERLLGLPEIPAEDEAIRSLAPSPNGRQVEALVEILEFWEQSAIKARFVGGGGSDVVLELGPFLITQEQREKAIKIAREAGLSLRTLGGDTSR
jgi:hypothetical protein